MITGSRRNILINTAPASTERKHAITIQSSQVSGSTDLTDFPVLITLDHLDTEVVDAGANSAQNGGGDLIFTSDAAGTNRLSCEIVNFVTDATPVNRRCQIWVKIPTLSATVDTTIYVWYKNAVRTQPAASAAFGSESVWTNFTFATHDCVTDSSGNYSITQNSPASTVEYLDANVADFNGSTNYHSFDISTVYLPDEFRTLLFSFNFDVSEAAPRLFSALGGTTFDKNLQVAQVNGDLIMGNGPTSVAGSNTRFLTGLSLSTWYRAGGILGDDYLVPPELLYNNGVESTNIDYGSGFSGGTNNNLFILGSNQGSSNFDGKLGHLFISNTVLSSDWIITDSNMINNSATFATAGTPVNDEF